MLLGFKGRCPTARRRGSEDGDMRNEPYKSHCKVGRVVHVLPPYLAPPLGLEPRLTVSKTVVLSITLRGQRASYGNRTHVC